MPPIREPIAPARLTFIPGPALSASPLSPDAGEPLRADVAVSAVTGGHKHRGS